jgi:hypothetical protein
VADGTILELAMTSAANDISQSLADGTELRLTVALRTYYHSRAVASSAI